MDVPHDGMGVTELPGACDNVVFLRAFGELLPDPKRVMLGRKRRIDVGGDVKYPRQIHSNSVRRYIVATTGVAKRLTAARFSADRAFHLSGEPISSKSLSVNWPGLRRSTM